MHLIYDHAAPKRLTNLTLNSDLLRKARELDINLPAALEDALEQMVRERMAARWLAENREAIAAYNAHIEESGVYSDGLRSF